MELENFDVYSCSNSGQLIYHQNSWPSESISQMSSNAYCYSQQLPSVGSDQCWPDITRPQILTHLPWFHHITFLASNRILWFLGLYLQMINHCFTKKPPKNKKMKISVHLESFTTTTSGAKPGIDQYECFRLIDRFYISVTLKAIDLRGDSQTNSVRNSTSAAGGAASAEDWFAVVRAGLF